MKKITHKAIREINHLRNLFPKKIHAKLQFSEMDGNYTVRISEFPGAITQAENLDDLITMVSDCIATILNVPEKYLNYMPRYLPTVELAQYMNAFPKKGLIKEGNLLIGEVCAR